MPLVLVGYSSAILDAANGGRMNPKYALFIWSSYALALAVVLWNAFAPHFRRNDLKRRLSESLEEPQEGEQ